LYPSNPLSFPENIKQILSNFSYTFQSFLANQVCAEGIKKELFLMKYLCYARQLNPIITGELREFLKSYFLSRRQSGINFQADARQLEGVIRLMRAHAKLRLAKEVNIIDAKEVIRLLNYSLKQICTDSLTGNQDIDLIYVGVSGSQRELLQFIKIHKILKIEDLRSMLRAPPDDTDKLVAYYQNKGDITFDGRYVRWNCG